MIFLISCYVSMLFWVLFSSRFEIRNWIEWSWSGIIICSAAWVSASVKWFVLLRFAHLFSWWSDFGIEICSYGMNQSMQWIGIMCMDQAVCFDCTSSVLFVILDLIWYANLGFKLFFQWYKIIITFVGHDVIVPNWSPKSR